jgi:metal-responsive CopG/Arc/MetJ family transcriptional regulator
MKTAISLPDPLFKAADALADRLGMTRSRLYATAIEDFIARHQARTVSERLNAVYGSEPSALDRPMKKAQSKRLKRASW